MAPAPAVEATARPREAWASPQGPPGPRPAPRPAALPRPSVLSFLSVRLMASEAPSGIWREGRGRGQRSGQRPPVGAGAGAGAHLVVRQRVELLAAVLHHRGVIQVPEDVALGARGEPLWRRGAGGQGQGRPRGQHQPRFSRSLRSPLWRRSGESTGERGAGRREPGSVPGRSTERGLWTVLLGVMLLLLME